MIRPNSNNMFKHSQNKHIPFVFNNSAKMSTNMLTVFKYNYQQVWEKRVK